MKSATCRYCAETFTPLPGKPGYIDECPECLHEKTAPPEPNPLSAGSTKQREKYDKKLIRSILAYFAACGKPISEERARKLYDRVLAEEDNLLS